MLSVEEALQKVLENVAVLPAERASLERAVGRVLAEDLDVREGLPPFDNSAMDGFAVRSRDLAGAAQGRPIRLRVREVVRAGAGAPAALVAGEAVRIMTGAPVPEGADAVVMKELVIQDGGGWVELGRLPAPGDNIRPRWEDVRPGEPLLPRGRVLRAYEIALLAAQGMAEVPVIGRPSAAVLATGDELVDLREPALRDGQIRDSNGPALAAALQHWGASVRPLGIAQDDPGLLRAALGRGKGADLLIVSGGVSVGDFDLTRGLLEEIGMRTVFWKVAMKPGKPLLFGLIPGPERVVPVFGLPGNPVSALVCAELFVRPALEMMQGKSLAYPSWHLEGVVANGYRMHDERRHFLFCEAREAAGGFALHIIRPQGSAMVGMACRANALAMAPLGRRELRPGDRVPFRWLK